MVNTTSDTLSVNGTVLNTLAKNISSLTGRLRAPGSKVDNLSLPGMHGELWIPNKKYAANTLVLPMWVQGCDDDGGIPTGKSKRQIFYENYNALVGLFKGVTSLLDVRWARPDGTVRQCYAEATDVFDFTTDSEGFGAVSVVLSVPGAFWQDITDIEQVFLSTVTAAKPTKFVGGSAPTEDMVYTIVGPWNNPRVTFPDGSYFQYNFSIPANQGVIVNCGEWELTGTGGHVPDYTKLVHDGEDACWGALPPMPAAAGTLTLGGTARTTASTFTMRGRRKYLIG